MKTYSYLTTVFALAIVIQLPAILSAHGATALFDNASPVDAYLSNTQTTPEVTINWRYSSLTQNRWAGFAFSAPSNASLEKVSFQLMNTSTSVQSGALGASGTIYIISLTSLTSAPATTTSNPSFLDTVLYSESFTLPVSYGSQTHLSLNLTTPFLLSDEATAYGIVLSFDSNASSRQIDFSAAGDVSGDLGRSFYTNSSQSDGTAAFTTSARPMNFILYAIPEPSSVALLLLGGGTMLWRLRHRP